MEDETKKEPETKPEDNKALSPDGEILSDYDKALALVERREAATKAEREILEEKKTLAANQMIGGNTGGHVEAEVISPEDKKKKNAAEFFKGTSLGEVIEKS